MKYIFLDIDGTILDQNKSYPSLSLKIKHAVKSLRDNGHKVLICSGRHMPLINNEILEIEYDGFILANGSFVYFNHEIISEDYFTYKQMKHIEDFADKHNFVYYLEDIIHCYTQSTKSPKHLEFIDNWLIPKCFNDQFILNDIRPNIAMLAYDKYEQFEMVKHEFEDCFDLAEHHGYHSCDINIKNTNKAYGIKKLVEKLGINLEDTMAFGDGFNDIEMLQYVGEGVCMANGCKELKAIAKYHTTSVSEDGVYEYLLKKGLIKPYDL